MNKKTQMEIVYDIVRYNQPIRTDRVREIAGHSGASCGDRFLRWLQEAGYLYSKKLEKDRTKTWYTTTRVFEKGKMKQPSIKTFIENNGQACMLVSSAILFIFLFTTPAACSTSSGKEMTKRFEGFRSTVYKDKDTVSVGYGFNTRDTFVKSHLSPEIISGKAALDKKQAEYIFDVLYAEAEEEAIKFVGRKAYDLLSESQKNILIDMAYNLGGPRLSGFKLMKAAIIAGDYVKAAEEMKNSKWYKDVKSRAKHHVNNFSKGK